LPVSASHRAGFGLEEEGASEGGVREAGGEGCEIAHHTPVLPAGSRDQEARGHSDDDIALHIILY